MKLQKLNISFSLAIILVAACTNKPLEIQNTLDTSTKNIEHAENIALPLRLAFMSGHVEAGLALYRAGEFTQAAPHLLHPVSETHATERHGLDALGFKGELFEIVSVALENKRPAREIVPQLMAAENNIKEVTRRADGNKKEVIEFLMNTVLDEYTIGVPKDTITDLGEYQDAYGFTVVALRHAKDLNNPALVSSLETLLASWDGAPVKTEKPKTFDEIKNLVSKVKTELVR